MRLWRTWPRVVANEHSQLAGIASATLLGFEYLNGGPDMMDQRNMIIAGAIAVAAVLAYYYFANTAPAPKKEGTSQNHYHAIPAPMKYASITKNIA